MGEALVPQALRWGVQVLQSPLPHTYLTFWAIRVEISPKSETVSICRFADYRPQLSTDASWLTWLLDKYQTCLMRAVGASAK